MRNVLSVKAAIIGYKGTILPLLEYGDLFMLSTSLVNRRKLQTLQNKRLRCALNKGIEIGSNDLHKEAKVLKLQFRREQHLFNFMFDWSLDPGKLKTKLATKIITRSHNKKLLKLKKPSTEKFRKCFAYLGPKKWNQLGTDFHSAPSKQQLKSLIKIIGLKYWFRWPTSKALWVLRMVNGSIIRLAVIVCLVVASLNTVVSSDPYN